MYIAVSIENPIETRLVISRMYYFLDEPPTKPSGLEAALQIVQPLNKIYRYD